MNKKVKEKREILRNYFFKFYRAGIVSSFKKANRRKTLVFKSPINLEFVEKPLILKENKLNKNKTVKEVKEAHQLKDKIIKILEKMIFKADRRKMIILKKKFQKFYLTSKLESLKDIIDEDKVKKKKKKKKNKKENKKENKIVFDKDINKKDSINQKPIIPDEKKDN